MTDLELLDRYRIRGDKAALDRLVDRYYSFVLRVCRRQLRNNADADDAAQQVFGHLLSHAPQVHTNVAAWLHRCAHNVSVSLIRSQMARRRSEQAYLEHGPRTHDGESNGDLLVALDECLATMPDHDRELIIQTQLLRVPQRVMAQQRGVSQQAVAKQVARSLDRLRVAISARGFAVTAAALAATLEGEASATLIAWGAAAAAPHLATTHLATTAASTLATTTKLKLLGTAVASVVLLSLPGTIQQPHVTPPDVNVAQVDDELLAQPPVLAAAPVLVEPRLFVEPPRNGWGDGQAAAPASASRRVPLGRRTNQAAAPTTIAPAQPTPRRSQETEIAQSDPYAPPRRAPSDRNLQERIAPRWGLSPGIPGGGTATPVPLVGTPISTPLPIASPTVVQHPHGSAMPRELGLAKTGPTNAAPIRGARPSSTSQPTTKTGMASSGGAKGGGVSGSGGSGSSGSGSSGSTASVRLTNTPAVKPVPPTTNTGSPHGLPANIVQIRRPAGGEFQVNAPPYGGAISVVNHAKVEPGYYVDRNVASHGGPPGEPLAGTDNFILTLDNPKSMPVIDVPRMVQLSAPTLRMASAMIEHEWIDPNLFQALLVPLDAHDVVTLISDCVADQGNATSITMSVAMQSGVEYGAPGLSPEQLMLIAGDDTLLPENANADAHRVMSIHEDFANALCLPLSDGSLSAINRSVIDGSSLVAMQLSAVPEPAAWQLAVLAGAVTLLVVLARRFRPRPVTD